MFTCETITDTARILNFLSGVSPDYKGRMFADILALSDKELEECHDQIQWLFPLHEESKFATVYPILTKDVVMVARLNETIIANLIKAKYRFEKFLGIGSFENKNRQAEWCCDKNHNLLRITRIIRSLRLFGLKKEAKDFYKKVREVGERLKLNPIIFKFWDKALNDDVWASLR